MQIQISWLLQKPTDLDLHCLQRKGISGFSRTRVKNCWKNGKYFRPRSDGIECGIALDKMFFYLKVLTFFLFLHENVSCGYSLEAPQ